jgi:hypothetical protein
MSPPGHNAACFLELLPSQVGFEYMSYLQFISSLSRTLIPLAVACLSGCLVLGPDEAQSRTEGTSTESPSGTPRIIRIFDVEGNAEFDGIRERWRIERAYNLTQWAVDPNDDVIFEGANHMTRCINQVIPRTYAGLLSIDWEFEMTERLRMPPDSPEFIAARTELIKALRAAKAARPRAQVGYYGLPLREYWNMDDDWKARSRALLPLFREADWIGPSIYALYVDTVQRKVDRQDQYITTNMNLALELAKLAGDKPVYVFINHRIQGGNRDFKDHLVSDAQFARELETILEVTRDGTTAAGIIWWSGDYYFTQEKGVVYPDADETNSLGHYIQVKAHYAELIDAACRRRDDQLRATSAAAQSTVD